MTKKLAQLFSQLTTDELYRRLALYDKLKSSAVMDILSREMIERELDQREIFKQSA